MPYRRTAIVHTILAGHMSRVDAARRNEAGVQVMKMGRLAARLAGAKERRAKRSRLGNGEGLLNQVARTLMSVARMPAALEQVEMEQ